MRQFDQCPLVTAPEANVPWKEALQTYGKCPSDHADLEQPPLLQLFNPADDPGETKNLAGDRPDRVREKLLLSDPSSKTVGALLVWF